MYFHSQLFFGPQTQLLQNECRQAYGTVKSVVHLDLDQTFGILVYDAIAEMLLFVADIVVGSSHQTFDRKDGMLRVFDEKVFGFIADQDPAVLCKVNDGGDDGTALFAGKSCRLPVLHHRHQAVGGTQVDTYDDLSFLNGRFFNVDPYLRHVRLLWLQKY